MNALNVVLKLLLAKFKEENLSEFEVVHIISDSKRTRNLLLKRSMKKSNTRQYAEGVDLLKKICRRRQVRWSFVEGHTGVFGNLAADSLAKKGSSRSETKKLKSPMPLVILRWNADTVPATIFQAEADENHRNSLRKNRSLKCAEEKEFNKINHFCKCHPDHVRYF